MKKNKLGNSNEMADVTLMALKMNGYENPKKVALYAYNPVKHRIRNLKHTTVITDYQKPEGYKPHNPKKDMNYLSRVFPSLKMEKPIDMQGEKTVKKGLTTRELNRYRYDHNIKSKVSNRRHSHGEVLMPPKETKMEKFVERIKRIFS